MDRIDPSEYANIPIAFKGGQGLQNVVAECRVTRRTAVHEEVARSNFLDEVLSERSTFRLRTFSERLTTSRLAPIIPRVRGSNIDPLRMAQLPW